MPLPFMQDESSLRQCIGAFAMVLSEYVGGGRRVKFRAFFGEISALSWKIRPPRRATSRPIRAPSPSVAEDQAPAQATSPQVGVGSKGYLRRRGRSGPRAGYITGKAFIGSTLMGWCRGRSGPRAGYITHPKCSGSTASAVVAEDQAPAQATSHVSTCDGNGACKASRKIRPPRRLHHSSPRQEPIRRSWRRGRSGPRAGYITTCSHGCFMPRQPSRKIRPPRRLHHDIY